MAFLGLFIVIYHHIEWIAEKIMYLIMLSSPQMYVRWWFLAKKPWTMVILVHLKPSVSWKLLNIAFLGLLIVIYHHIEWIAEKIMHLIMLSSPQMYVRWWFLAKKPWTMVILVHLKPYVCWKWLNMTFLGLFIVIYHHIDWIAEKIMYLIML